MSYTNAKACGLLASHCCVCGRPLVDAKSVEIGIGPVCRKNYMSVTGISEEARQEANALVYDASALYGIDASASDIADICKIVDRLHYLGFPALADRMAFRFVPVRLQVEDDVPEVRWSRAKGEQETGRIGTVVNVWTPRNDSFKSALNRLSYRRPVRDNKRGFHWQIRRSDSRRLLGILSECYPGVWAISDKGTFQIPSEEEFKAQYAAPKTTITPKGEYPPGHRADDEAVHPALRGSAPVVTFDMGAFKRRRMARQATT